MRVAAVDNVTFDVPAGQMVGIIDRSGAGKSTLLRMINRLTDPTSGRILWDDAGVVDVGALRGRRLREWRARCAMVFQQFNLVPRLQVLTNVRIGRISYRGTPPGLLGFFSDRDRALTVRALERADTVDNVLHRADALSYGQQQSMSEAAARFERQYTEYRRGRMLWTAVFWAGFVVCFVVSMIVARFDVAALAAGLPRTTEFLVELIPPIGWSAFAHDMGEWYWGARQVAYQPAQHAADGLSRDRAGHHHRRRAVLLRRAQPGEALRRLLDHAAHAGDRLYRAGHRLGAALRAGLRHRAAGRRARHRHPYAWCAGQAVRRGERERESLADRGHPRLRRQLAAQDALRRATAGPAQLHVLHLLAHRAERALRTIVGIDMLSERHRHLLIGKEQLSQ